MNYGNYANRSFLGRFLATILGDWFFGRWHIAARCTVCGRGEEYAGPGQDATMLDGDRRWFCSVCGSDASKMIKWVGRCNSFGTHWEWLAADRLPRDLQPVSRDNP